MLCGASLLPSFANAQIDWSEGFIGIYSDSDGSGVCLPDTLIPANLYIVLETEEVAVSGFQAGMQGSNGIIVSGISFGCAAVNLGTNGDIIVGYGEPKPVSDGKVVLAEISVFALNSGGLSLAESSGVEVVAFLNQENNIIRPYARYGNFGLDYPMYTFGVWECPIELPSNGFDPVSTVSTCLGSIKALYLQDD